MSKELNEYLEKTMCNVSKIIKHYVDENKEMPKDILNMLDFTERVSIRANIENSKYKGVYNFDETIGTNLVRTLDKKYYRNFINENWILNHNEKDSTSVIASQLLLNGDIETLKDLNKKIVSKILNTNDEKEKYNLENSYSRLFLGFVLNLDRVESILEIDKRNKDRKEYFEFFKEVLEGAEKIYCMQRQRFFKDAKNEKPIDWKNNWLGERESISTYVSQFNFKESYVDFVLRSSKSFVFFEDAINTSGGSVLKTEKAFDTVLYHKNKKVLDYYIDNNIFEADFMIDKIKNKIKDKMKKIELLDFSTSSSKSVLDISFYTNFLEKMGVKNINLIPDVLALDIILEKPLKINEDNIEKLLNVEFSINNINDEKEKVSLGNILKSGDMLDIYMKEFNMSFVELRDKYMDNCLEDIYQTQDSKLTLYRKFKNLTSTFSPSILEKMKNKLKNEHSADYFLGLCLSNTKEPFNNIYIKKENDVKTSLTMEEHNSYIKRFLQKNILDNKLPEKNIQELKLKV